MSPAEELRLHRNVDNYCLLRPDSAVSSSIVAAVGSSSSSLQLSGATTSTSAAGSTTPGVAAVRKRYHLELVDPFYSSNLPILSFDRYEMTHSHAQSSIQARGTTGVVGGGGGGSGMTSSSSSSLNMSSEANLDDKVDFLMTKVSSIPSKNMGDLRV